MSDQNQNSTPEVDQKGQPAQPSLDVKSSSEPAPTHAPEPRPEPKPEPKPEPTFPKGSVWDAGDTTGDAILDLGIDSLTRMSGCSKDDFIRIIGNAVERGDMTLLDEALIAEKYKGFAPQFRQIAEALINKGEADRKSYENVAYGVAGSEESWKQAVAVFNENAPEHMKLAVRTIIDSGNIKEGAQLLMQVVQDLGVPTKGAYRPVGNGSPQNGLSAEEFRKEFTKLRQDAGNRSLESGVFFERYQDLMARRAMGRRAGL